MRCLILLLFRKNMTMITVTHTALVSGLNSPGHPQCPEVEKLILKSMVPWRCFAVGKQTVIFCVEYNCLKLNLVDQMVL